MVALAICLESMILWKRLWPNHLHIRTKCPREALVCCCIWLPNNMHECQDVVHPEGARMNSVVRMYNIFLFSNLGIVFKIVMLHLL